MIETNRRQRGDENEEHKGRTCEERLSLTNIAGEVRKMMRFLRVMMVTASVLFFIVSDAAATNLCRYDSP